MVPRKAITVAIVAGTVLSLGWVAAQTEVQTPEIRSEPPLTITGCPVYWKDHRVIASKIPGRIDRIYVQEGDTVLPGQELARLDARETELEHQIQKILGESDLNIRSAAAQLKEFYARLDAAKKLKERNATSDEQLRLAYVQVEINELAQLIETEKQQVEKLKSERLKVMLDDHIIRSPMKGIVQKIFKRERESLSAVEGLQLFRIVNTDQLWVEGQAPGRYLYRVRKGQRVEVKLSFVDERRNPIDLPEAKEIFEGEVVYVDPDVQGASGRFLVRAQVDNRNLILHHGLTATMKIYLDSTPQVVADTE